MDASILHSKLAQELARWTARRTVPFRLDSSVLSITFDDFPRSALDCGGRILEARGLAGTYYTSFGLANTQTPSGMVGGLADLAACVERGHEIACHTYDHLDCIDATSSDLVESLLHNQAVAHSLGLPPLRHFAYPFGRHGIGAKKTVMHHYSSARSILRGVNRKNVDLSLLKSVPLYDRPGRPKLTQYLDNLASLPGWLILYTHDVSQRPSFYGCTPHELDGAIARALELGISVLPVGAVVDKLLASGVSQSTRNQPLHTGAAL